MATIDAVPDGGTVAELKELIAAKTGVPANRQLLKAGFPPKPLAEAFSLSAAGVANRDTLTLEEREAPLEAPQGTAPASPPAADAPAPAPAAAAAPAVSPLAAPAAATAPSGYGVKAGPCVPAPAPAAQVGGMERHIIAADNSCLFNSVAYLLQSPGASTTPPQELRALVSGQISKDPERWDPVTLAESSKTSLEYAEWITRSDSWGGSLELIVLSEQLGVQISSVCVRSLRVDHFPHEATHRSRLYVCYDGIHYDAIIGKAASGGGSELRVFDPADEMTLNKVVALAIELQENKQFTDTANFTLQCQHCFKLLKGEADAQQHAKETGHFNFQEAH